MVPCDAPGLSGARKAGWAKRVSRRFAGRIARAARAKGRGGAQWVAAEQHLLVCCPSLWSVSEVDAKYGLAVTVGVPSE